jgi:hypothetical protein
VNNVKLKIIDHMWLLFLLSISCLFGQENSQMSSEWIDVQGRTSEGVKIILKEETRKIDIYTDQVIDESVNNIEIENDERTKNFNSKKADLRANLNLAIDEKNSITMAVNDLKEQIALQSSTIMNYRQRIIDAEGSIANSNRLIKEEKNRVLDELTKIPFFEVLIGKVENLPPDQSPIPYEDAIASKISRKAIDAQLGVAIIKETIIADGTLNNENIITLLKGKANTNLNRYEDQIVDSKGRAIYNLYRYGLVAVYPFQESDVALQKATSSGIKVEVQVAKSVEDALARALDNTNLNQLSNMLGEKKLKNAGAESQIKRLAETAKQVIKSETRKIKASEKIITRNRQLVVGDEPGLKDDEILLQQYLQEQQLIINNFTIGQNAYNSHVGGEEYVRVFAGVGQATATEEKESRFAEIAANTYEDFITSVKSEYIKEETRISNETIVEIKESKKADIKLNSVKIVGKFSKKDYGKINLITYVAYNFGFEFEQSTDSQFAVTNNTNIATPSRIDYTTPTPSKSFNFTISTSPSGAVVKSGRKTLGTTPLQTYLEPGLHSLVIKKDGFKPALAVLEVTSAGVVSDGPVARFELVAKEKMIASNKKYLWGGLAVLGGGVAIYLLTQDEGQPIKTGSVALNIRIPL